MELSAIRHEVSKDFIYKVNINEYLFKIICKKDDVKKINFYYKEKYTYNNFIRKVIHKKEMTKVIFDEFKDYYEVKISVDYICIDYYFEIYFNDGNKKIFTNYGFFDKFKDASRYFDVSQHVLDAQYFDTPNWLKNGIVYQIFPDRFASSKYSDKEWSKVEKHSFKEVGGDIKGILLKLNYIKNLGIDILYLCPLFESETYHKYSTINYLKIDSCFGTNEDFKELVSKCHDIGIKVIIDLVFNHTGVLFDKFQDVIKNENNSKYENWYFIKKYPLVTNNPKPNYKSFAYVKQMPKVNTENEEVRNYFFNVVKYWYEYANVDGFRLDVADEVSHDFWYEFRKFVKELNKDLAIVGERWYESNSFLTQWDSHMNYIYRFSIIEYLIEKKIKLSDFIYRMNFLRSFYNINAYYSLWNLLDSHDTPRFLFVCKNNVKLFKNAVILQFLQDGPTFIYYGSEVGMTSISNKDIDARYPMEWLKENQNQDILFFYKCLINIKKTFLNKFKGEKEFILIDDKNDLLVYKKYNTSKRNYYYVIFNNSSKTQVFLLKEKLINLIDGFLYENKIAKNSILILKRIKNYKK